MLRNDKSRLYRSNYPQKVSREPSTVPSHKPLTNDMVISDNGQYTTACRDLSYTTDQHPIL